MSQNKETSVLIITLLLTLLCLGAGAWWFTERLKTINNPATNNTQTTPVSKNRLNTENDSFAKVTNVPSGRFNYGGSTTWAPLRRDVDTVIQTVFPQFQLIYTPHPTRTPGSTTGISMLLDDQLAFSQSSRSLKDEEYQTAEQRGFKLKQIPVAIDGIAIAVHPDLNISGLTIDQIQYIYTGQITNWNQLGGPDLAITPYTRQIQDGGTVEFFRENILNNQEFMGVEYVKNTTEAIQKVSKNLGGVYYASAPEVVEQCSVKTLPLGKTSNELIPPYQQPFVPLSQCPSKRNQLNINALQNGQYPLTRRLFVIVKQNGQIDEQAGEAYANLLLTSQGQDLIRNSGFIPIK